MKIIEPINILLVEDSIGDIRLTKEALKESKLQLNLHTTMDGIEAMDFLYKRGQYRTAPTPDLIILDLNLPRKDGREVLKEVKEHPLLKSIPIAVLTISSASKDIIESYNLHVNCFITKPLGFDKFIKVVNSIENFWFTIVTLPPKRNHEHE